MSADTIQYHSSLYLRSERIAAAAVSAEGNGTDYYGADQAGANHNSSDHDFGDDMSSLLVVEPDIAAASTQQGAQAEHMSAQLTQTRNETPSE